MSDKLQVSLVSPEKVLFEGEALSINLPGSESAFAVFPDHVNMIGELAPGLVSINLGESQLKYIINGGFVEVKENRVSTLVEGAILPDEIDVSFEENSLNEKIKALIAPEEREFFENEINSHRARITYSSKK